MCRFSNYVNIEYNPQQYDDLFKSINTNEDLNFCVYELIHKEEKKYIGNGRFWLSKSGEYILSKSRPFNHKDDDYEHFILTHKNECTIRIVCANRTKHQVMALEAFLIKCENPPLNKIHGAERYISDYLNV